MSFPFWLPLLAGAIHLVSPDHWMPYSILGWQRGWSRRQKLLGLAPILAVHTIAGFVAFLAFRRLLLEIPAWATFDFWSIVLCASAALRGLRFSKARSGWWSLERVITYLGPAEALAAFLLQAAQAGKGYLLPSLLFWAGSCASGALLILASERICNHPRVFTWSYSLAQARLAALPASLAVLCGLYFAI